MFAPVVFSETSIELLELGKAVTFNLSETLYLLIEKNKMVVYTIYFVKTYVRPSF